MKPKVADVVGINIKIFSIYLTNFFCLFTEIASVLEIAFNLLEKKTQTKNNARTIETARIANC